MQQLPLFNRLQPEGEIGVSLSNFQGGGRLNTKRTRKFALRSQSGIHYIFFVLSIFFFFFFPFFLVKEVIRVRCMFKKNNLVIEGLLLGFSNKHL